MGLESGSYRRLLRNLRLQSEKESAAAMQMIDDEFRKQKNDNLMKAAQDLLSACERIAEACSKASSEEQFGEMVTEAMPLVHAAIAKAKRQTKIDEPEKPEPPFDPHRASDPDTMVGCG